MNKYLKWFLSIALCIFLGMTIGLCFEPVWSLLISFGGGALIGVIITFIDEKSRK